MMTAEDWNHRTPATDLQLLLRIIHGESPDNPGVDVGRFRVAELPSVHSPGVVNAWLDNQGFGEYHPDVWLSVVPVVDDDPLRKPTGERARLVVDATSVEVGWVRAEIEDQARTQAHLHEFGNG